MRNRQWPGWYGVDIICGTIIAAALGLYDNLTALRILEYYNLYHNRWAHGPYCLVDALATIFCFAPFGAVTGLAVSAIADRRSAKRPLRRLRFLLWFIGPALPALAIGNLVVIRTAEWEAALAACIPFLLPLWAMGLARVMTGWQSDKELSAADPDGAADAPEKQ